MGGAQLHQRGVDVLIEEITVVIGAAKAHQRLAQRHPARAEQHYGRHHVHPAAAREFPLRGRFAGEIDERGAAVGPDLAHHRLGLVFRIALHRQQEFLPRAFAPGAAGLGEQQQQRDVAPGRDARVGREVACLRHLRAGGRRKNERGEAC